METIDNPTDITLHFNQTDLGYFCLIEKDLISNFIRQHGIWEPHLYYFYSRFIKPDFIVIDAGANIGFHSVQFAKLANEGKTYCFEPQPLIFNVLTTNILFNGLTDVVEQYKLGLGNKEETLKMKPLHVQVWGPDCINWGGRGLTDSEEGEEEVQLITLDSLGLPKLDLIKLDIQGSEPIAVEGGLKTIKENTPIMFLEGNLEQEKYVKLIKDLKDLEYIVFKFDSHPWDFILLNPEKHKEEIELIETQSHFKLEKI